MKALTKQYLQRLIYINRDTLRFYWRQGGPGKIAGTLAGSIKRNGEQMIPVLNTEIPASHVVWFLNHGKLPEWKIGYRDKDPNNILIRNLIEIKKPERVDLAERKAKAKADVITIENLEKYIHDWMDLDEKKMRFTWKTTYRSRIAGKLVGKKAKPDHPYGSLVCTTPRGTTSSVSYHKLAWIWHYGKYPKGHQKIHLFNPALGYAKENMTLSRAEYNRVTGELERRPRKGYEYLFCHAPTTKALRSMNAKWRAANRETRDKEGLRGYDPWKVAARFEKALREAYGPDYANAVFDIENHRAIKRRI